MTDVHHDGKTLTYDHILLFLFTISQVHQKATPDDLYDGIGTPTHASARGAVIKIMSRMGRNDENALDDLFAVGTKKQTNRAYRKPVHGIGVC
jgi:hypothetical protein